MSCNYIANQKRSVWEINQSECKKVIDNVCSFFVSLSWSRSEINIFFDVEYCGKLNKSKVVHCCLYSYRQRYSSSQWSKCCGLTRRSRVCLQQILTTVMTNIVVDKSSHNNEPRSICFLPQYSAPKKLFISERDQNHNSKKEQALSITFSKCDWFISQNERS